MSAVSFRDVSFTYSDRFALRGIELDIKEKETVLFSGPNGSGKTTLLRIVATLLTPSSGRASVLGHSIPLERYVVRPRIGALFAEGYLYDDLTVEENLSFYARAYGAQQKSLQWLERFGMETFRNVRAGHLSRGERQKVAIARALLHSPSLLLLDEPTTALDEGTSKLLTSVLKELKATTTILCATHDPRFLNEIADRTIQLNQGSIV